MTALRQRHFEYLQSVGRDASAVQLIMRDYQAQPQRHYIRTIEQVRQCRYLGPSLTADEVKRYELELLQGKIPCRSCSGKIPALHCSHTQAGPFTFTGKCTACQHWESRPTQPLRHLLYHLWPCKLSLGTWQRNLDQLKLRWPLFNGRKIIAVATSSDAASLQDVQGYMRGYECEWAEVANDPSLREVKSFRTLFERLQSAGENEYIFYGQGKGATKKINSGVSVHTWAAIMYEVLLDYWPLVEEYLKKFPIVGAFKKHGFCFAGSRSDWHYSGSFFWYRAADLYKRSWKSIDQTWYGIESYPSLMFKNDEAACIFWDKIGQFDLYKLSTMSMVEKELVEWRLINEKYRSIIASCQNG